MIAKWVCVDCGWSCMGDRQDAHAHHHEEGCWDHWIYEFQQRPGLGSVPGPYNVATGFSIHTSDFGGFYPDHQSMREVAEVFMLKMVNWAGQREEDQVREIKEIKNSRQASWRRVWGRIRG